MTIEDFEKDDPGIRIVLAEAGITEAEFLAECERKVERINRIAAVLEDEVNQ